MFRSSFRWTVPGKLAGSGRPGLYSPYEDDVAFIMDHGIHRVVTLTEHPLDPPISYFGLEGAHFPIADMGVPTIRIARDICEWVIKSLATKGPVLIHCKAGLGRTGTLLGCCLIEMGSSPAEAMTTLRQMAPYLQTEAQEDFLHDYSLALLSPEPEALPRMQIPRTSDTVEIRPLPKLKLHLPP